MAASKNQATAPAVNSNGNNGGGSAEEYTRDAFLAELEAYGLKDLGKDVGLDAGRYSASKCNGDMIVGYPWKKEVFQGGAEADGKGWIGYLVRLVKPCTALFGKDGKETVKVLESGRDIIVPANHKLADELDRIIASGVEKISLVAIKPSHQIKTAKNRPMWEFHFREIAEKSETRQALSLPAHEVEDDDDFGNANTALGALAQQAS